MPVGGIKEKIIAAHRAGVKRVIIPEENEQDLKDVPDEVREALTFYPVNNIEAVLKLIFDIALPEGNFISDALWSGNPDASVQA